MSLKERVGRADTDEADLRIIVAEVREALEQRKVRLNISLVGRNLAEKLTC